MFSLNSEGFGEHLNNSHDPERDTAVPEKDPADQKKHCTFGENNAAASLPAVFDWKLDEKLDVLQIPKPEDYLGTRIVKEACSMSICKTHYMSHFKTGTMYRENTSLFHTKKIKADSEKVQLD